MANKQVQLEGSVDKGQWVWNEENGELNFKSIPKSRGSRSRTRQWTLDTKNLAQTGSMSIFMKPKAPISGTISLEDVKVAAVELINEEIVKKTQRKTCKLFDDCFSTKQIDDLLWSTLIYYNNYNEHKKAISDENVSVPGSLGNGARQTLKKCSEALLQSKVNLGEAYSKFILGLGHKESHHCQSGRSRVSKTQTDREFYEVVYEFILYVVWITYSYTDWDVIHDELGRFFRTPQFNRDFNVRTEGKDVSSIEVEGFGTIEKTSDQYLTYKVLYDRPFVGMLKELHSTAHVSYLPEPKDKYPWVFETKNCKPPRSEKCLLPTKWSPPERLGIIGDSKEKYDPQTLRCLETDHVDSDNDNRSDSDSDSIVSGIIEDEGESEDLF